MKTIIPIIVLLCFTTIVKSQLTIGTPEASNSSVSLEFSEAENRGIILPYVEDKSAITESGTLIYDVTDHKVKYLKDSEWIDLSVDDSGLADISIQTTKTELPDSKMAIGNNADTDETKGLLVLTDTDKAMILPKVPEPHLNIIDPSPGMIVYDTTNRLLAVFNGSVWTFWKP
ncbi:hypothetical protein SAMN05443634_11551 [Chishuiella changwenlii]|uniref:Uncharacterized protein n=1 Tax=Chishuiella changwenlii TaxID=1434701 RepID=A0A1M7CV18_9FLAO|nr:hypothetical protein [Chishuiella changwenlii]GGF10812.1 hypothetical protein GCM10010984_29920 [Chishuiella changwenlii]SHL71091.1 hypothetical protein SAMN05443634_11551 [Chishuiella changwenlii]